MGGARRLAAVGLIERVASLLGVSRRAVCGVGADGVWGLTARSSARTCVSVGVGAGLLLRLGCGLPWRVGRGGRGEALTAWRT